MALLLLTAPACSYYSFTGATIPEGIDAIAIPLAPDNSSSPFTDLDGELTDLLIDRFVGQTRLRLQTNENEADAVLATRIEGYENEPTAVSGDERATLNRVRVQVAVQYVRQGADGEEDLLDRTFNSSAEYDPAQDGRQGERDAALAALEAIADDIFSQATSNW